MSRSPVQIREVAPRERSERGAISHGRGSGNGSDQFFLVVFRFRKMKCPLWHSPWRKAGAVAPLENREVSKFRDGGEAI